MSSLLNSRPLFPPSNSWLTLSSSSWSESSLSLTIWSANVVPNSLCTIGYARPGTRVGESESSARSLMFYKPTSMEAVRWLLSFLLDYLSGDRGFGYCRIRAPSFLVEAVSLDTGERLVFFFLPDFKAGSTIASIRSSLSLFVFRFYAESLRLASSFSFLRFLASSLFCFFYFSI